MNNHGFLCSLLCEYAYRFCFGTKSRGLHTFYTVLSVPEATCNFLKVCYRQCITFQMSILQFEPFVRVQTILTRTVGNSRSCDMMVVTNNVHTANVIGFLKRDAFILQETESFKNCSLYTEVRWQYKEYFAERKHFDSETMKWFNLRNDGTTHCFGHIQWNSVELHFCYNVVHSGILKLWKMKLSFTVNWCKGIISTYFREHRT